jgi:hypothetical protein
MDILDNASVGEAAGDISDANEVPVITAPVVEGTDHEAEEEEDVARSSEDQGESNDEVLDEDERKYLNKLNKLKKRASKRDREEKVSKKRYSNY